ncbi:MAG: NUDIX hydrolase [Thermomicrobium sp.]|nr:NUDIX hydrolase [Thermomicrobium sp.]
MREQLLTRATVYSGRLVRVHRDEVLLPDGQVRVREVVHHPGAVAILAVTEPERVILVRQYRHAIGRVTLELPAGTLEEGERPEDCALRELEEETGYRAGRLRELIRFAVSPGWTDEQLVVFIAEHLEAQAARPAEDERVTVVELHPEEARAAIQRGDICDAKSLIGLMAYYGWRLS